MTQEQIVDLLEVLGRLEGASERIALALFFLIGVVVARSIFDD